MAREYDLNFCTPTGTLHQLHRKYQPTNKWIHNGFEQSVTFPSCKSISTDIESYSNSSFDYPVELERKFT